MRDPQTSNFIAALIASDGFQKLEPALQKQAIHAAHQELEKTGGFMGKLLGNASPNLPTHAALILCLALLLIVVLDLLVTCLTGKTINMELVKLIIPVITLTIGYLFGRGAK